MLLNVARPFLHDESKDFWNLRRRKMGRAMREFAALDARSSVECVRGNASGERGYPRRLER